MAKKNASIKKSRRTPVASKTSSVPEESDSKTVSKSPGSPVSKGENEEKPTSNATRPTPTRAPESRRAFLARAGTAAAGLCGGAVTLGILRGAQSNTANRADLPIAVGRVSDFKVNTITYFKEAELFVIRDDTGIGAISAECTHLGCTVRRTSEGFACPCHGAVFDTVGHPTSGPARRPLPWYAVKADRDGTLLVYLSREAEIQGPAPIALPSSEVS